MRSECEAFCEFLKGSQVFVEGFYHIFHCVREEDNPGIGCCTIGIKISVRFKGGWGGDFASRPGPTGY